MQLTERQCWDVIRALVAEKNKEYASFIARNLDEKELALAVGFTKNIYLNKFGFKSEAELRYLIKRRGVMPKEEWLDNLSTEDLLLFLDFRCRSLQDMYNYFVQIGVINLTDVNEMLVFTKPSKFINYNYQRLLATGRPEKVDGEKSLRSLNVDVKDLKRQALIQALGKVAYKYSYNMGVDLEKAVESVLELRTHNVDNKNQVTGYRFRGTPNELLYFIQDNIIERSEQRSKNNNFEYRMVGYNKNMEPVFMSLDGRVANMLGMPLDPPEVVYNAYKEKIEDVKTCIPDFSKGKYMGVDYQGTPIYEIDGEYYKATGEMLEEPLIDTSYENNDDEYGL